MLSELRPMRELTYLTREARSDSIRDNLFGLDRPVLGQGGRSSCAESSGFSGPYRIANTSYCDPEEKMGVHRASVPVGDGWRFLPAVRPVSRSRPPVAKPRAGSWSKPWKSQSANAIARRQTTTGTSGPARPGKGMAPRAFISVSTRVVKPEGVTKKARPAGIARPWSKPSPHPLEASIRPKASPLGHPRQFLAARKRPSKEPVGTGRRDASRGVSKPRRGPAGTASKAGSGKVERLAATAKLEAAEAMLVAMVSAPKARAKAPGAPTPVFETHAERRFAKATLKIAALADELPPESAMCAFGGELAEAQVLQESAYASLIKLLRAKGGAEGTAAANGLRAWRLLQDAADRKGLANHGLPASPALIAEIVLAELARAIRAGTGGRGGATVGTTIQSGFAFLQKLGLPVVADHPVVLAAAVPPPSSEPRRLKHAGSMPLKIQLQLETLAAAKKWSVARTIARALLVSSFIHHVRLNDALNNRMSADEYHPDEVVRGCTTVSSKDGLPLELYAPAEGWLGPLDWLGEHMREMGERRHALPAFESSPTGCPSRATRLMPGVMPQAHALKSLRDLCSMAPLCMSEAEFNALNLTTHSPHGTGSDMGRFMGLSRGWSEPMCRQLGHWLRDKNAPQADPRKVPGAPTRGVPDGAPCARGIMSLRYSQGGGRRGERQEQLEVRAALIQSVRKGLRLFGKHWTKLPAGLEDWDILLLSE